MSSTTTHIQVEEHDGKARISIREASLVVGRGSDGETLPDTFRAGELILGGLGACILGTVRAAATAQGISVLEDVRVSLKAEEAEAPPRITRITWALELQGRLTADQQESLFRAARGCKIGSTLDQGIELIPQLASTL